MSTPVHPSSYARVAKDIFELTGMDSGDVTIQNPESKAVIAHAIKVITGSGTLNLVTEESAQVSGGAVTRVLTGVTEGELIEGRIVEIKTSASISRVRVYV